MKWKDFYIAGDDGVLNITATKSGIDKNKLNTDCGIIPYITRTDKNNGIDNFITANQSTKYKQDDGNVITIGLDTQTVFYQPYNFYTGQNIQVLSNNKNLNKYVSLFICVMLQKQLKKFNWGGNGATIGRLKRTKMILPINAFDKPDYGFMQQYAKMLIVQKLLTYTEMQI